MICRGCGHETHHIRTFLHEGQFVDVCAREECGNLSAEDAGVPDVYLGHGGQKFQNLADETGRPIEIKSKRHKAEVMKKLGVREAGDRMNGAPIGTQSWVEGTRDHRRKQFDKNDRPMLRKIWKEFKDRRG